MMDRHLGPVIEIVDHLATAGECTRIEGALAATRQRAVPNRDGPLLVINPEQA
jgi:hypothetical protein